MGPRSGSDRSDSPRPRVSRAQHAGRIADPSRLTHVARKARLKTEGQDALKAVPPPKHSPRPGTPTMLVRTTRRRPSLLPTLPRP